MKRLGFILLGLIFMPDLLFATNLSFPGKEGAIAYFKMGSGSRNVILVPGIGDTKENYLELAQILAKDVTVYGMDLRGMGGSDTSFSSYGPEETGKDIVRFIQENHLTHVTVISNSMSAASAVYSAAELPEQIEAIVLTGPFVRDGEGMGWFMKLVVSGMFRGPWGAGAWKSYYQSLYPKNKPADLEEHSEFIKSNLQEEGRLSALRSMLFAGKGNCEQRIGNVKSKVLVLMGTDDPDFENPEEEAIWIAKQTKADYVMFENAGHYPYKEDPKRTADLVKEIWQKK
ncbi:alpha/beta fold hydrolase [Leptospira ilyithenensis]|uniref:Alpha/beta hydrolase n=1 Tax=Leptospira ilyithenensis TaxID=2484901 RepID=A0A4R9LUY6_9LEPT|nr:alpha/beta hydrolase [Leptospira ilyithenensis]TGN14407.1 alpha/beta hydrolase [Leptospira ilyithenensis]